MKTIEIKAGERVRVIHKFSNSLIMTYNFDVEPRVAGEQVSGSIEIASSSGFFKKPVKEQNLSSSNSVDKGAWDSFYSVYVIPDIDVVVSLKQSSFARMWPIFLIALAVIGLAMAIVFSAGF